MNTPNPRRPMGRAALSTPRQAPAKPDARPVKSLASSTVFNGAMKITRQGKLILTK